jgi:flagellar biosynthesis/type III secretory pathway protein FliH
MDTVSNIRLKMGILLTEMYELGKEEGKEENAVKHNREEADSFILGYDKGCEDGYEEAMREHRAPDL